VLAWLLSLAACNGEPAPTVTAISLVDRFPLAEVRVEGMSIERRGPGGERQRLPGWSRGDGGRTALWNDGSPSVMALDVVELRDLVLRLRARPFVFPGAPQQTVTVVVNGARMAVVTLRGEGATGARIPLPASSLVEGYNRLEFRYAYVRRPVDVLPGGTDERALAVAWELLQIVGGAPSESPGSRAAMGRRL
jgi:hypothetical protein